MNRRIYSPEGVIKPTEPFSQAISADCGRLLFIAGQLAVDKKGVTVGADIQSQATQVFHNLGIVLEEAGASFSNVLKFTTFLVNAGDVAPFCDKRRELLAELYPNRDYPANSMVVIDQLPKSEWLVEIEAIATLP